MFSGVLQLLAAVLIPETYPLLPRRRTEKLSEVTSRVYRSAIDIKMGVAVLSQRS